MKRQNGELGGPALLLPDGSSSLISCKGMFADSRKLRRVDSDSDDTAPSNRAVVDAELGHKRPGTCDQGKRSVVVSKPVTVGPMHQVHAGHIGRLAHNGAFGDVASKAGR